MDVIYKGQTTPEPRVMYEVALAKLAYYQRFTKSSRVDLAVPIPAKKKAPAPETIQSEVKVDDPLLQRTTNQVDQSGETPIKVDKKSTLPQHTDSSTTLNSISSSLNEIGEIVTKEKGEHDTQLTRNQESLIELWNQFLSEIDSPYFNQLTANTILAFREDHIYIEVDHKRVEEVITKEYNLIKFLRQMYHDGDLQVDIVVNEEHHHQENARRLVTSKEKFDYLVEENPDILELVKRFKLTFD